MATLDVRSAETPVAAPAPAQALVSYRTLVVFLIPLLFTGMMMTFDSPVVNGALTRLPDAQQALAAMVVALSLAFVYEAPHVSMIEVATALATTRQALGLIRRFYVGLAAVMALLAVAVLATPLYDALVPGLMGIPAAVATEVRGTLVVFLFWPVPIGWRRLHQGALIRFGHSRAVGAGATIRVVTLVVSLAALLVAFTGRLPGSTIGTLAMLISVTAEAAYTDVAARRLLAGLPDADPSDSARRALTLRALWDVFWPLAGTAIINTLNRPLLSAGIAAVAVAAAGAGAEEPALAAWGVAWGLAVLLYGPTLTLSQVSIAWEKDPRPGMTERGARVILGIGLLLAGALAGIAFTPLAGWLLGEVYVVTPALAAVAQPVMQIVVPVPLLMAASALVRGRLIARGRPRAVRTAQIVDLLVLAAVLTLGLTWPLPLPRPGGALVAALGMLAVGVSDLSVLAWRLRSVKRDA